MKYVNAKDVLPQELIEQLQNYVQGSYVYIPKKEDTIKSSDKKTDYRIELEKRNAHIYLKYLQNWSHGQIAKLYHLSLPSIRRIILEQRKRAAALENMIKQALSCVMEGIELLFAAYFISVEDTRCALDVIKVYQHICNLEEKIYREVK